MLFTFSSGENQIQINKQEAYRLEILLNKSMYKREWIKLGDTLYEIHTGKEDQTQFIVGADRIRWMAAQN